MGLRTQVTLIHAAWSADTSGPKSETDMGQHSESTSLCLKIERAGGGKVEIACLVPKPKTLGQGMEESCWQHLGLSPKGRALLCLPLEAGQELQGGRSLLCHFQPLLPSLLARPADHDAISLTHSHPFFSVNHLSAPSSLF